MSRKTTEPLYSMAELMLLMSNYLLTRRTHTELVESWVSERTRAEHELETFLTWMRERADERREPTL